jgi:hypothetical protein
MFATRYLKQNPHSILRSVGIKTDLCAKHTASTMRYERHCDPIRLFSMRTFSSNANELVHTKLDLDAGIAEITMQNGSVNSLSLEM